MKININYDEECEKCKAELKWNATINLPEGADEYELMVAPKEKSAEGIEMKVLANSGGYKTSTKCPNCGHWNDKN